MTRAAQVVETTSQQTATQVPWSGRDLAQAILFVLVTVIFVLITVFVTGIAVAMLRGSTSVDRLTGLAALGMTIALEGSLLVSVWLFGLRRHHASWRELGFYPLPRMMLLLIVVPALGLAFLTLWIYGLAIRALHLDKLIPQQVPELFLDDPVMRVVLIVLAVLVAPFAEEVFFRGFAFTALRRRWRFAGAAGASSMLFGLAHLELGNIAPTIGLGLLLTYLFHRSGSLWTSVLTHSGFNAVSLLALTL